MSKFASPLISLAMGVLGAAMFAAVTLQPTTPGTKETGNINVSGTVIANKFMAGLSSSASIITAYSPGGGTTAIQGSAKNFGMRGYASATSGLSYGGYFESLSPDGFGIWAKNKSTTGLSYGLVGEMDSPSGVAGRFVAHAASGLTTGLSAEIESDNINAKAVAGDGKSGYGGYFLAKSGSGWGVYGEGANRGISGISPSIGVYGISSANTGTGVIGTTVGGGTGSAIHAYGNITATGAKTFKIDHPADPENKYLLQYCAEGDTPQLQYRGIVKLDSSGGAIVNLPAYFGEINRDPMYVLTAVGAPMPNLYVAEKVKNNRFRIAGGKPGAEVSWMVNAIRNDRYIRKYGAPTEMDKPESKRGTYLQPELYGQPKQKGEFYTEKEASTTNESRPIPPFSK